MSDEAFDGDVPCLPDNSRSQVNGCLTNDLVGLLTIVFKII